MRNEFIRNARASLVLLLGILARPGSAPAEDADMAISPALSDLSPGLSLALPLPAPGLLEAQAAPAPAPAAGAATADRQGHLAAKTGLGFILSPTDFLLILQGDYFLTQNLSIGPLFQFGVSDDPFIFAPTVNVQWMFDLQGDLD